MNCGPRLRSLLFLVGTFGMADAVVAQPVPIDLGTLGGTYSFARDVNDSGHVVGESGTAGNVATHAFVWTATSGMVDLGTLGGTFSIALAVNEHGQVVGTSSTGVSFHAFSWTATGGMVDLTPESFRSDALGVNDLGQVVGLNITTEGRTHAFLWTPTEGGSAQVRLEHYPEGMLDLGTLGGVSYADAINNSGQVIGHSQISPTGDFHAFSWTAANGMVDLGTLGGPSSGPTAINNQGQVVGEANVVSDSALRLSHAFLWTSADGMVDLGTLGGATSVAIAVNDDSQVGGWSLTAGNGQHAFLWTPTDGMVDLGTLGGVGSSAWAVNSSGHVVGESLTAGNSAIRGFVWTPAEGMLELVPVGGRADSAARRISNRGEVVGISYNQGFPVPTANIRATMWLLVDAQQQLEDAIAVIASWNLRTLGTSLPAKLEIARTFEAAGATRQACDMLNSFLNQVRAQTGKGLTADQATELTMRGIRIQNVIGC